MSLRCPACGSDQTKVTDSRSRGPKAVEHGRFRRRQCSECDRRFTTVELVVDDAKASIRKANAARWARFEQRLAELSKEVRDMKKRYAQYKKDAKTDVLDYDELEKRLRPDDDED